MSDLNKLRTKLCRELAQAERDASLHTLREARRLGDVAPALALRAIADHAEALSPRLVQIMRREQTLGLLAGRAMASVFSGLRHVIFDRVIDSERSYRATLLGLRHGIDTARLLRAVAVRSGDRELEELCLDLVAGRTALMTLAEEELAWFADQPARALASGLRVALSKPA
jgi:hypothetical protein